MESVVDKLVIQEKDLELVISNKVLGSLTTNAKDIKALVEKALPNYDVANYNESNIDLAKKDKAMLNNAAKVLNAKRLEIEKEFNKPFAEFKEIISDTIKLIGDCSSKIDGVVRDSEQKEKDAKKTSIVNFWNAQEFKLVPLEKVFIEKWLNKTAKMKDVEAEIKAIIAKINDDIVTIEAIGKNVDLIKSLYLDTLNLNTTIQYANTLNANSVTAKENEAERGVSTSTAVASPQTIEAVVETVEESPAVVEVENKVEGGSEILVRTMRVTATKDNIIALANFMNERGITFEKLSND